MSDLRERIVALSPDRREELEQRLMASNSGRRPTPDVRPRGHRRPCPLSFAQQRLWFLDQLAPGSAAYNTAHAVRLDGVLDVTALRKALDTIVARHEILRTTVSVVDGEPYQVVGEGGRFGLAVVELSGRSGVEGEGEVERVLADEARRPFDLGRDPMLRATLIRLGATAHVLLVVMHHIASDGWSFGVLWRELGRLYDALRRGQPDPLPELPIQYADYACWQREQLGGETLARELAYWRQRLAGAAMIVDLPADRARPPVQSFRGARLSRIMPVALVEGLKALARSERATLFMGVLAGFQALVHRYTGQEDICLGSVVAGRTRVETEDLIGFFVNTLVFRTDFAGDPTVRELLERVRQSSVEAFAHQALPFERLVEELGPERSLDRAPVVQVALAFQDAGWSEVALADLRATPVPIDTVTAKFDLSLSVTSTGAGLATRLEYSTDLFLPATAARLLGHLETLLGGMVASPDARVSRLPLLTEHERRQVVVEWNASRRPVPGDCGVAALFEAAAARDPDAVAVESADRTLTYRELNGEANRLARHLRLRGVAPGALVGVSLERSTDFVVTVLAILKAGGAYVPIDPGFPADRQAFVLADTRATALVTRREHGAPDAAVGPPVVWLDADADGIDGESDADLGIVVSGEDLAYVMYTSGSTGQPKGVMIPHRAIARLVLNTDYVTLTPADVVGHASNVAFDAATFEIWGALLNGARLAILDRDTVLSPRDLGIALRRHGVTILFLTTALFNQVAQEAPGELAGLRTLLVGGEALDPRWVARQLESAAPGRFLNAYGPTETTTFATWHLVQSVAPDAVTLPIGRPIANTEVYILDRHLAPVPIGVAGELCIGGPGLARGYLNQPELTAQKFVPHPFAAEPGARLYRTGDLARWRADGTVDFIGRLDDQVKIRGHRVEPGEVETALGRHAKVRESVVVAEVDRAGSRRLVAYVVAEGPTPPAPRELRAFLRQSLPEWMVPAAFVFLPVLPVTANGKVDRARLPSPAGPAGGDAPEASGPRDALEIQLTRIWEDVLGTTPIGIHDNFFDLGGHSLLAMRLFARIESALGKPLPLATLFKTPTVAELADVIRAEGWWMFGSSLVGIQTRGARPPLFALPGHDGNLLTYADLGRLLGDEQPFYGLQARGLDGRSPPIARVEAMAAHYLEELRRVQPQGPYYLLGACMGAVVAFEMAQQLHRTGERVALLALLEPSRPGWRPARPFRAGLPPWLVVPRFFLGRVGLHARTIAGLGAAARRAYLRERLRMVGEMVAHRDVFRGDRSEIYQMHVSEASKRALRRYAPRRYPGSVTVFLTAGQQAHRPLAWTAFVQGDLELQEVPGRDLHGMLTEPHVRTLATRLEACLRRARSE